MFSEKTCNTFCSLELTLCLIVSKQEVTAVAQTAVTVRRREEEAVNQIPPNALWQIPLVTRATSNLQPPSLVSRITVTQRSLHCLTLHLQVSGETFPPSLLKSLPPDSPSISPWETPVISLWMSCDPYSGDDDVLSDNVRMWCRSGNRISWWWVQDWEEEENEDRHGGSDIWLIQESFFFMSVETEPSEADLVVYAHCEQPYQCLNLVLMMDQYHNSTCSYISWSSNSEAGYCSQPATKISVYLNLG